MEYVGEARAKYNPKAPLIGITPLGVISGGERLRGVDVNRCPQGLQEKVGWGKYGYNEHRLPTLAVDAHNVDCYDRLPPLAVNADNVDWYDEFGRYCFVPLQ